MYWVDKYIFKNSIEYEYKFAGKYGAKGEKRAKRTKATPEQIKKQNQRKKETYSRRLLKLNFDKGDLWCTLLYPKGTKKPLSDVKEDMKKFLRKLRTAYKARDEELKFMYRIEIGSRGGIHIHMICNHISGDPPDDILIQSLWQQGRVHYERFGGTEDDFHRLANYIVKEPTEEQKNHAEDDPEKRAIISYSSSRNLIRPQAERKTYQRWTVRKILTNGPKPTEGYHIDQDSIYTGINQYTGMTYLYYTEVKNDPGGT